MGLVQKGEHPEKIKRGSLAKPAIRKVLIECCITADDSCQFRCRRAHLRALQQLLPNVLDELRTSLLRSFEMKLPGAQQAVVDINKLRDYCLNPLHPRGRHKARVFASALRMLQTDAELLKTKLLDAVLKNDAAPSEVDEYGRRYIVDFECVNGVYHATVRSGWIIRHGEEFPYLTTCYVRSDKDAYE